MLPGYLDWAFMRIVFLRMLVHVAGRSDTGVPALAQCAYVDVAEESLSAARWTGALNALLPPSIRVLRCHYVSKRFHARHSAKGKVYRYRIWSAPVLPPFEYGRVWHVTAPLDFEVL